MLRSPEDGGKGGGGISEADLAAADKAAAQKSQSTEGQPKLSLADRINKVRDGDEPDNKPDEKPAAKKPDDQKPDDKKPAKLDEEFPEIPSDIAGSQAIKDKFARLKKQERALFDRLKQAEESGESTKAELAKLKTQLEEASKKTADFKSSEEYLALQKSLEEKEALVASLSLQDSDWFKQQFDVPLNELGNKADPWFARIGDPQQRQAITQAFVAAITTTPPGDKNDPEFYSQVERILKMDGMTDATRRGIDTIMMSARKLVNERAVAIANWKETASKRESDSLARTKQSVELSLKGFDQVRQDFIAKNSELMSARKEHDEKIGYSKMVDAKMSAVRRELEATIKSGVASPGLLALLNDSVELAPLNASLQAIKGLAAEIFEENKKLRERLVKLGDIDPEKRAKPSSSSAKSDDRPKSGSAMVDAFRKVRESADV